MFIWKTEISFKLFIYKKFWEQRSLKLVNQFSSIIIIIIMTVWCNSVLNVSCLNVFKTYNNESKCVCLDSSALCIWIFIMQIVKCERLLRTIRFQHFISLVVSLCVSIGLIIYYYLTHVCRSFNTNHNKICINDMPKGINKTSYKYFYERWAQIRSN